MAADLPGKSIVLGKVRMLRTTETMAIYLLSLLPPSVPMSPIESLSCEKYSTTGSRLGDKKYGDFFFLDLKIYIYLGLPGWTHFQFECLFPISNSYRLKLRDLPIQRH